MANLDYPDKPMTEHAHVVKTKHAELTLDQIAEAQPGMARLMKEVGERYHILYFAAKGGNWRLAQYELNAVTSILKTGAMLRPKYAQDIASFTQTTLQPISEGIRAKDWKKFDEAFRHSVEEANKLHDKYGYEYVHYVLPSKAPDHLNLEIHE